MAARLMILLRPPLRLIRTLRAAPPLTWIPESAMIELHHPPSFSLLIHIPAAIVQSRRTSTELCRTHRTYQRRRDLTKSHAYGKWVTPSLAILWALFTRDGCRFTSPSVARFSTRVTLPTTVVHDGGRPRPVGDQGTAAMRSPAPSDAACCRPFRCPLSRWLARGGATLAVNRSRPLSRPSSLWISIRVPPFFGGSEIMCTVLHWSRSHRRSR